MVSVLAYAAPHRKTHDLLLLLKAFGHSAVSVFATPWVERKNFQSLYPHRPASQVSIPPSELCKNLGFDFLPVDTGNLPAALRSAGSELVLIAGAGILPPEIVSKFKVINSHPAYLPYVRGLDALKWAIYEDQPVGVTTHIVDEEADAGILIKREKTPIYPWDTFHSLAYRQYEQEIRMLAESLTDVINCDLTDPERDLGKAARNLGSEPHRRMSHMKEVRMMKKFETMVQSTPIE